MPSLKPNQCPDFLRQAIRRQIAAALEEDGIGDDLSSAAVNENVTASARVISREMGVLAGAFWFDEVFSQIDPTVSVRWHLGDGDVIEKGTVLCTVGGNARSLLRGERCALNFLQTLSGTATATAEFVACTAGRVAIKDTRKTLPGLRLAQKYAVACGGGANHRMNLSDAILLKDNHVRVCGSVTAAVTAARQANPGLPIEIEASSPEQVEAALAAGVEVIMLDNFDADEIAAMVKTIAGRAKTEISGGVGLDNVSALAKTGADCVSVGALTKNLRALDLSMQFD